MSDYKSKIAYQGEPGAYSYLACKTVYPELEPVPYESFAAAFAAVENRETTLAMIPIENSLGGRVADIHHLIPDSKLYIIDEHYQPVTHCLLGLKSASIDQLTHVRSHPQGLAQCLAIFDELGVKPVTSTDTAGSAREVRDLNDPTQGAIASALAGEIYGLDVLREQVEDRIGNTTRFIILSDTPAEPDPADGPCMTSFTFKVRSVPAALYKSLGGFATCGVNLTKLESYIMDEHFQVAQFYAEIEGHPSEKMVDTAFEELQFYSTTLKILGTYPANPYRTKNRGA